MLFDLRWLAAVVALESAGCGAAATPAPSFSKQPEEAYAEVPYPPPSAMAEIVPPQPDPGAVWVDGQWLWRGRYWVWDKGGWVVPPDRAKFSRWDAYYRADGTLLFAEGAWRDPRGRRLPPPRVLAPAATPPTEQTAEPAAAP
jgi:hypothetical protein